MQDINIKNITKEQVREFLPDALEKALFSYEEFMRKDISMEKSKDFSDHHSACKAAIAHVNLLLKLAEWADMDAAGMGVDPVAFAQANEEYKSHLGPP